MAYAFRAAKRSGATGRLFIFLLKCVLGGSPGRESGLVDRAGRPSDAVGSRRGSEKVVEVPGCLLDAGCLSANRDPKRHAETRPAFRMDQSGGPVVASIARPGGRRGTVHGAKARAGRILRPAPHDD